MPRNRQLINKLNSLVIALFKLYKDWDPIILLEKFSFMVRCFCFFFNSPRSSCSYTQHGNSNSYIKLIIQEWPRNQKL
uniref:Ovule protein n=1 Tax=Strongyloides venezuelensis TaxID=75913 RepID=A0A0K0F130_STRVS